MSPWYDRPDGRPRNLTTDLVTLNGAQWFLRCSETEVLAHVARGHLSLVGHRHHMLRADELRALRGRLPRLGRGDWLK
jgi:hypothetical protein